MNKLLEPASHPTPNLASEGRGTGQRGTHDGVPCQNLLRSVVQQHQGQAEMWAFRSFNRSSHGRLRCMPQTMGAKEQSEPPSEWVRVLGSTPHSFRRPLWKGVPQPALQGSLPPPNLQPATSLDLHPHMACLRACMALQHRMAALVTLAGGTSVASGGCCGLRILSAPYLRRKLLTSRG